MADPGSYSPDPSALAVAMAAVTENKEVRSMFLRKDDIELIVIIALGAYMGDLIRQVDQPCKECQEQEDHNAREQAASHQNPHSSSSDG